jgi:hypothetical protein
VGPLTIMVEFLFGSIRSRPNRACWAIIGQLFCGDCTMTPGVSTYPGAYQPFWSSLFLFFPRRGGMLEQSYSITESQTT